MQLLVLPLLSFAFFVGYWAIDANAQFSNEASLASGASLAVPEPITLLIFGTTLASVGMAARRKIGPKVLETDEIE